MKSERTKAVSLMLLTFIVGIMIGIFIPGLVFRFHTRNNPPPGFRNMPPPHERFERMLFGVIHPDSLQIEKIKPLTHETTALIDTVQSHANKQIKIIIDSMKIKLQPILTPEQQKNLEEFGNRARGFNNPNSQGRRDGQKEGS